MQICMFMGVRKLYIFVAEYSPSKNFYLQIKRKEIRSFLFIITNKKNNCTLYMGMAILLFQKFGQGNYFPTLNVKKINV
jgi:hypothetical protein